MARGGQRFRLWGSKRAVPAHGEGGTVGLAGQGIGPAQRNLGKRGQQALPRMEVKG